MSFLPFVLSFLLLLVIGSSFLFSSFRSTSLERMVILSQKKAHLLLISEQAIADYKSTIVRKKPEDSKPKETKVKPAIYKDRRNKRQGYEASKFNLWPLLSDKDKTASVHFYNSAIRLIQILYQDADFYKKAHDPDLAKKIVDQMILKKGDDFLKLFPKDEHLAQVYYKMLKGSNTGYPPLGEYFKIEKTDLPPLRWPYATTPVLQAVFGEETTLQILAAEKAAWEENHREWTLSEDKLRKLLQNSNFDNTLLKAFFSFNRHDKGLPHTYVESKTNIMAIK